MLWWHDVNHILFSYLLDLAGTIGALYMAGKLHESFPFSLSAPRSALGTEEFPLPVIGLTLLIWTVVFFTLSIYDPRRTHRTLDEIQSVIVALLISFLILAGALYFSYRAVSRVLIGYFFMLSLASLIGWRLTRRLLFRLFNGRMHRPRRVLIIGANELGRQVAETIRQHAWTGLELWGYVDDPQNGDFDRLTLLGSLSEICDVIKTHNIEEVVIALQHQTYQKINQIVVSLQALPVQILIVPDYFSLALYRATVGDFGGLPLISLRTPALTGYQRLLKRAFDILVASLSLLSVLPIMVVVAIVIKLDSHGPILFKQQRVGENGRLFTMYKFRSMIVNAEAQQGKVIQYTKEGHLIHKVANDPRVTRVGRFIRKASLDELPQLINVIKGDMSLVGPRPEMPWLVEQYEPWQRKRFAVPQGITGWWQVNGRSTKPMHLSTEDDLYYVQNYSFWLDIQILWKTIPAVLKRRGAI